SFSIGCVPLIEFAAPDRLDAILENTPNDLHVLPELGRVPARSGPVPHTQEHRWHVQRQGVVHLGDPFAEGSPVRAGEFTPAQAGCPKAPPLLEAAVEQILQVMASIDSSGRTGAHNSAVQPVANLA